MDVYFYDDYKDVIRQRLKEMKKKKPGMSLRYLAERVPVQYTYFSKVLNQPETHLSPDHLFVVSELLQLSDPEIEYLQLLRSFRVSKNSRRQRDLEKKVRTLQKKRVLNVPLMDEKTGFFQNEVNYFFQPLCVVVHAALSLKIYRENPFLLCSRLNVSEETLQDFLKILEDNGFLQMGLGGRKVEKMLDRAMHYGPDHPLTRIHQNLSKTVSASRLAATAEKNKKSFQATFTTDEITFFTIQSEFQIFLKKVEQAVGKGKDEGVFQLNFDLFRWL